MKFFKRLFIGLLATFLIGGISYWWRYTRSINYNQPISSRTNLLINIDLRKIENSLLWDFFYHPFDGFNLDWSRDDDEDDEDDADTPSKGLSIPRHLLLFTQANHPGIYISPVPLNGKKFSKYVDSLIARKELDLITEHLVFDSKKQLYYAWSKKELTAAFAKKDQANLVQEALNNLLNRKNTQPAPLNFAEHILKNDHHINIWHKPNALTNNQPLLLHADLSEGLFLIEGNIPFVFEFAQANQAPVDNKDLFRFWANLDWNNNNFADYIKTKVSNTDFSKWTSMSIDSVLQFTTGEWNIRIPTIETRMDSIITYEYDENFNKIDKITTQQSTTPSVNFMLSTNDTSFYHYGKQVGIIKTVDNQMRFVGFPLLKLFATQRDQQLLLTNNAKTISNSTTATSNFLQLGIDISAHPAILDYLPFALDNKLKENIEKLTIQCKQLPNYKGFHFKGELFSKKHKRFFLNF